MTIDRFLTNIAKLRKAFPEITRLAIVGAGMVIVPMVIWLTFIIWKTDWAGRVMADQRVQVILKQLDILGVLAVILAALLAVVIVALVGVVKYVKAEMPGGAEFEISMEGNPVPEPASVPASPEAPAQNV